MNIVIIGASGAIGRALSLELSNMHPNAKIYGFSGRKVDFAHQNIENHPIHFEYEASIEQAAHIASQSGPIDLLINATGFLHNEHIKPEKSLRDLSSEKFQKNFLVNTIGPALVAKHFLPKMHTKQRAVFAAISARVGSISDNQLGGWYAYRASKSALNMVLKNASIEMGRRHKQMIVVGLHPGTVDSNLSEPFQSNVKKDKLFTPQFAAQKLIEVLDGLTPEDSGHCFAWDGQKIEF